jgi:3-keto-disaccharide hydrolase
MINEQKNNKNLVIAESPAATNDDINFTSIFDGKTLNSWKMAGEGKFVIAESDAALQSEGGMGLLWYSESKYKNFILKLEWKASDEVDNSGVFVRFPDPDDNPNNAVRKHLRKIHQAVSNMEVGLRLILTKFMVRSWKNR